MKFHWFVVPFSAGLIFLILYLIILYTKWIVKLPKSDKKILSGTVFSSKIFNIVWEIFSEALLHIRIFRKNVLLGYMHSSFAFGWFLLIVTGAIETQLFASKPINHLYEPIFFKFFNTTAPNNSLHKAFAFLMDLWLLYVLSGIFLALSKRFYSRIMGLKKTTQLYWTDQIALISLWLIFPLRLLAESSTTATYQNGSFLTNTAGIYLEQHFNISNMSIYLWWAYSIDLLIFFGLLPFSRYMHIPTEIVLIALRHAGFKTKNEINSFSQIEIHSCSSCGICIDACQLQSVTNRNNMVPTYLFQKERYGKVLKPDLYNCLFCGRCEEACPVNISIINIKLARRKERLLKSKQNYQYLSKIQPTSTTTEILYFAGCMSHLTPSITRSMIKIFEHLNISYYFLDKDDTICCGRPLMLAGKIQDAQKLIEKNTDLIKASKAKIMITSCPICYKIFNEEYNLPVKVMHHSQWLSESLTDCNKLKLNQSAKTAVYHDPCDLGRGSNIYDEPRNVLKQLLNVIDKKAIQKEKSLCCGGSLADFYLNENDRVKIARNAYVQLINDEDYLITSCPLCKKTFQKVADKPVLDIAEIIVYNLS